MSLTLEEVPLATLVVDADRIVRDANDLAGALLRCPAASLVGRSLTELIAPSAAGIQLPSWADGWHPSAVLRSVGRLPEHDVAVRVADGAIVRCRAAGHFRREPDGTLAGAIISLRAVEPRGGAELSAIEVVSTVSHELRSPLTSVKGYTSLLLNRWDRVPDDQKREMLVQVHHDADRVTRLVTELLDISRLETGRLHLRRQLVDLHDVAATSVVAKVGLEYAGLGCTVDIADDVPRVYADPDKVEQVLTNLVENAAKYASLTGLAITASLEEGVVAVAVADRGEGIPASDLPRVFTKFFRRDLGKPTGTGLGLWISRGLVEAHGGRLTAESTTGQGSTFRFTLPTDAFDKLLEHHFVIDDIPALLDAARHRIGEAADLEQLRSVETDVLGKRSALSAAKAGLGALDPDARREAGRALNEVRQTLEEVLETRRAELESSARAIRLEAERLDLTEVMSTRRRGHLHLVTQARDRLEDVFIGMGFTVADGPEAETDWYNFGALNFPPGHPARNMYDTLYLEVGEPETVVLRTHTSPTQIRVMEAGEPPIYSVMPGRCFRQDTADASHLPNFHQIEGLVVDRGITFGDLAGTLDAFTSAYFGPGITTRLRPSYFPFTEPSAEFDITCVFCQGDGCRSCGRTGWLELGGCGMVHPNVFASVGYDPEVWSGFAFGFGIDRMTAQRSGIADLRDLVTNDIRFLEQF